MKSLLAVGLSVALISAPLVAQAGSDGPAAQSRLDRMGDWIGNHLGLTGGLTMLAGGAAMTWGASVYLEAAVALVAGVTVALPLDLAFVAVTLGLVAVVMGKAALDAWADEPTLGANVSRGATAPALSSIVTPPIHGIGGVGVTR